MRRPAPGKIQPNNEIASYDTRLTYHWGRSSTHPLGVSPHERNESTRVSEVRLGHRGGSDAGGRIGCGGRCSGEPRTKFAICNETFYDLAWPQEKIFDFAAELGYQGVEIAPFTINTDITKIPAAERSRLRKAADSAGIEVCGLHWILSKTEGLHLTTEDKEVRRADLEVSRRAGTVLPGVGGRRDDFWLAQCSARGRSR